MRVFVHSNAHLASHHRLIELLADEPGVDILYMVRPDSGVPAVRHASADGHRAYEVRHWKQWQWGRPGDPHRYGQWPPNFHLRKFIPDLIHCVHEQESLMTLEIALMRRLFAPQGQLIISTWQNMLRPRRLSVRLLSWFTIRSAQHAFCASTGAAEVLRAQGFCGGITVTPLGGVDTRWMHPKAAPRLRTELGLGSGRPVVGYVGRLSPEKGLDDLMRAIALLYGGGSAQEHGPQLLLVGDGPARAALESLARELNIAAQCRFVASVPAEQVVEYMNLLDVFVLPSRTTARWKEQFGRVLAEAMACRVPIIGSTSGAIPEVLGDAGRIFREADPIDLASHLRALLVNEAERLALAERGYRRALQEFTVEALAARVLRAWHSLIDKKAPS
jgi:glycosyltransferase involved in cell wall biosynthesis